MYIDPNLDNEVFDALLRLGFSRPDICLGLWVKNNLFCKLEFEHTEHAKFALGIRAENIDVRFPNSPPDWWKSGLRPYQVWLKEIAYDPFKFSEACGGWFDDGLLAPNFSLIGSIIVETFPKVELKAAAICNSNMLVI